MSQALTPAVGSKVGRFTLTAESPEALAASSFIGRSEEGQLARVLIVARAGTDAEAVTRAAAQARNLAHGNVLRLADADSVDGRLALSFEHVEGVSLGALVAAAGAAGLAQKVALRIALDLLDGLAAAHATGLGHGELGPHLAWVGGDGIGRVMGVGVARGLGKALAPKTASDRLAYIAPERVKAASSGGAPVTDPKCDVFSVAVILWELLAKQRLFAGRLESAVIQKVLTAPVAPLASAAEDVPDGVDEVLRKALERDPARRTATARELADALTAAATDGIATHEEVAAVVADLAKKPLEELRAKLTSAGATTSSGELIVPPARPSFPTLDEFDVQADDTADAPAAPVVRVPPKPPPSPPKAAPKPIAKPSDLKAPVKPIEVKVAGAKPEAKAPEAKAPEAKAAAAGADEPAATPAPAASTAASTSDAHDEAKPETAEAKPASAPSKDTPPPSDTKVSAKPELKAPAAPQAPKPGLRAPSVAVAAKRPMVSPRKGTLLGVAPPTPVEASKPATEPSPKPPVAAEKPVEAAGEKHDAEAAAPASKTPPQGSAPKADLAKAEAPKSAGSPPSLGTTGSERTPSTGGSPAPASVGKKSALTGTLKPGDTLGRYELLLPVATGGMASVWAARLEGTAGFQKTVAIKTMLPGMSSDADFEEMFLDEARVAARIRHPNVVEIFDLGEEGDTLYLVMEWVDGETFGALQKGSKPLGGIPLPILLRLASQACAGLHAAHELRDDKGALVDLVHRDISPANLLVSRTGFVKIVDFGVAKSKARMYTTRVGGMLKGKTPYLSPEQLAGQPIDRRSDIYSFGAVLYVLATGLHPFRGETEAKTIENIALRDPVPLRKIDPNIHPELEAIILKALAKDRSQRFETASEMQRALDTLAATIGQAVNDDDVAGFVKKVAGDGLEKRSNALREAIALADTGKQPIQPRGASTPDSARVEAAAAEAAAVAAAAAEKESEKVDIEDVDISDEPTAAAKSTDGQEPPKPISVPAIPPPPMPAGDADPLFNAPSLGSDSASAFAAAPGSDDRTSPPDTLAAASTEPATDLDTPQPRKRGPMIVVGGILGVCALIGVIALAQSGGDKPSASGSATSAVAAQGPETQRTGKPVDSPPATEAPATAAPATAAPTATEAPAATATATPEPVATAEPTADTPAPAKTGQGHVPTVSTAPSKPTVATKPTAAPKPTATSAKPPTTTTKPTKPPPKREFTTL